MPNRLINESCRASETLACVSASAERLFWRLLTVADDFGRFRAKPTLVRSICFPLMLDRISEQDVSGWLFELVSVGAIRLYRVDSKEYGVFPEWERYQQRRAKKSKFPEPPASSCDHVLADAGSCEQTQTAPSTSTSTDSSSSNPDPDPKPLTVVTPTRAAAKKRPTADYSGFAEFWQHYPRKDGKQAAAESWAKLTPDERQLALDDVPQRMRANWAGRELEHIPHAATYLNQRRWLDAIQPNARLPDPRPHLSPGKERLLYAIKEAQERERNGSSQVATAGEGPLVETTGRRVCPR